MRKITLFLMLFCAFVGMAWAGPLDGYDLSTQLFRLKNVGSDRYMTVVNTESNDQNAGGVQIKNLAGASSQMFYFVAVEGQENTFKIKSKDNYYLTTFSYWGYKATATDSDGANNIIEPVDAGSLEFYLKGANGKIGPNDGSNGDGSTLYSNHNATRDNLKWIAEPVLDFSSDFIEKNISIGAAATSIVEGQWYILNNHGRNNCVSQEGSEMKMRAIPANGLTAEDVAGKLFKFESTGTAGEYYIVSGTGLYFDFTTHNSAAPLSTTPVAYKVATIGDNAGHFYIQHAGRNLIADGQGTGDYFVCYGTDAPTSVAGNNCYHFLPVNFTTTQYVDVTYEYVLNGEVKGSAVVEKAVVGYPFEAPAIAYVQFSYPEGTITSETTTVQVTCTETLPFVSSASFDDAKWYLVDMHCNDTGTGEINNGTKKYVWTYVAGATNNVQLPMEFSKQTATFGDDKLWCFVGNVFDGFKIYNKAAGESVTLNKTTDGNNVAGLSDAEATLYTLVPSQAGVTNGFCLLPKGHTYYLNTQAVEGVKILKGWTNADGGSSCRVFAPTAFVKDAMLAAHADVPVGAVGALVDMTPEVNAAYNAIVAEAWNTDAITAEVSEDLVAMEGSTATIEYADGLYRIYSAQPGLFANNKGFVYDKAASAANPFSWGTVAKNNVNAIFRLTTDNDKVVLQAVNSGKYMQGVNGAENENMTDNGHITLTQLGSGQYKLVYGNGTAHANNHGDGAGAGSNIVDWNGGLNSASAWYLFPATDLDVTVTSAGYATLHLPFSVVLPETVKAYAVESVGAESASLVEKTDIPANIGAILEGEGTHTLTIATASSDWNDNLLRGTNVNTDITETAYVLADGEFGVGLYKALMTDGKWLNNANKAYLPASVVPILGAQALRFNFGETTGIEGVIESTNANAAIFDLSGRRVAKMQKGIYIVNGKKVYVK